MRYLITLKERWDLDGDLFTDSLHWRIQGALGNVLPLGPIIFRHCYERLQGFYFSI